MFLCANVTLVLSHRKFSHELKDASLTTVSVELRPQRLLKETSPYDKTPMIYHTTVNHLE